MISAFETCGVGWVDTKDGYDTDDLVVDGSRVLKLVLNK